jgi:transcriptional regulator with XRE-family HTH domain
MHGVRFFVIREAVMGKIISKTRENIAKNIKICRMKKFPGRGGGKKCAEAFGVSPQQWSPWERGKRTPDKLRISQIAEFFGVTVEYLLQDNTGSSTVFALDNMSVPSSKNLASCPFLRISQPGQPHIQHVKHLCWLAETLLGDRGDREVCIKLHPDDAAAFMEFYAKVHSNLQP